MIDPLSHDPIDAQRGQVPAPDIRPARPEFEPATAPNRTILDEADLGWGPKPVPAAPFAPTSLVRPIPRQAKPSVFERAIGAARAVLPIVQKILPLLDGNVASAAANFIAPQHRAVDLDPIKTAIGKLQTDVRVLRGQVSDYRTSLKTVEEDLAAVKETLERNSLEQRGLMEGMLNFKRRINRLAWLLLVMVILSIAFTALVSVRLAYLLHL